MKKRIVWLLVLTMVLTVGLVSCKKSCEIHVDANYDKVCDVCEEAVEAPPYLGFEGIYNGNYAPEQTDDEPYSKAEYVSALNDMTMTAHRGELVAFENSSAVSGETKYAVLNTSTGDVVLTLEKEDGVFDEEEGIFREPDDTEGELLTAGSESFIRVITRHFGEHEDTYTVAVYTSMGREIVKLENMAVLRSVGVRQFRLNLYEIDGKVYEITDGEATYRFDRGLSSVPAIDCSTPTHHYCFTNTEVMVYDPGYQLVAYYAAPGSANLQAHLLADGNVLIQYVDDLPDDAEEYDVYTDGVKCNLYTLLYNVADGTTTEFDLNCVVQSVKNIHTEGFENTFASSSVQNVAYVYDIDHQRFNRNSMKVLSLDNDLSVQGSLALEIPAQNGTVTPIASNRFVAADKAGKKYLLNEKGETIGEVTAATFVSDLGLFYSGGRFYDLDLKVVFDESEIAFSLVEGMTDYKIFADTDEEGKKIYYVLNGVTMKRLSLPDAVVSFEVHDDYFCYSYYDESESSLSSERIVVYCNAKGEKIYSVNTDADEYRSHTVQAVGNILLIELRTRDEDYNTSTRYYVAK